MEKEVDPLLPQPVILDKPYINLLLYGPPGSGKTVLAATAQNHPAMADVLYINFEGGLLSLGTRKGVQQIRVKKFEDIEKIFWKLANKEKGFEKIQTVVLDSGSEMQTLSLEALSLAGYEKDQANSKKPDDKKRGSRDEIFQDDYGKDSARLKRIFRWFRDAPFHTIITALSKKEYDKPASRDQEPVLTDVMPAFTNKLGQSVMGYVDYVWYLSVDPTDGKRKMLTRNRGVFKAKTRGIKFSSAVGEIVEEPDIAKLYDLLLKTEA